MVRTIVVALACAAACAGGTSPVEAGTPPAARTVKLDNPVYQFEYSYPAAAAAIPGLKARLDADLAQRLAKLKHDARAAQADAKQGGFPYHPWSASQAWQVVSSPPGWLSLSATFGSYTGGAHGNYWFGAMLWDKRLNKPRDPLSLFTSKQALGAAIRKPFCAALDRERAARRGAPVKRGSTDPFDECIDPTRETVILGSRSRRAFDRIGILVPPYEAGPYSEGSYEVTVPVTAAVLAAVRPEYRSAFAAGK